MFLTRLYRYVMETYPHLENDTYDIVERVMRPFALRHTRRPRSDRGKACRSVSSSSSHHQGTSSHQYDDDDDDDVETSRASTLSPTTYQNAHLKTTYKNLFDSIKVTWAQTKAIINSLQDKLHDTIYENAKLRAQLFDKVSEQKDTNKGKSNALSKPVTSNSTPSSRESTVVNNERVNTPIFRINPFKASRVDNFVPNKHVKSSIRTKLITVSQPHVITKNDVNSKTNGFSLKDVKSTTRTRRPQPRNNPKSDKVPFKSKSSCLSSKLEKIEENYRSLQSSSNQKHMSSECNNIKLAIWNAKSKVVYAMCKKCLITANHDVCVLNYVNDMNSRALNKKAHVSNVENQKKHRPKVWKPKKVGSKERLASPKTITPRSCLRWSPTGRFFYLKGKIIASNESVCQSNCSKGDNACTSNPQEPINKSFKNVKSKDVLLLPSGFRKFRNSTTAIPLANRSPLLYFPDVCTLVLYAKDAAAEMPDIVRPERRAAPSASLRKRKIWKNSICQRSIPGSKNEKEFKEQELKKLVKGLSDRFDEYERSKVFKDKKILEKELVNERNRKDFYREFGEYMCRMLQKRQKSEGCSSCAFRFSQVITPPASPLLDRPLLCVLMIPNLFAGEMLLQLLTLNDDD
ncbi:hypothetical protein Tco_1540044 [Tanacetum coccineum]